MSRVKVLAAAGACAWLVAGCSSNAPGDLTPAASRVLAPAVQHVREVAATNNYPALRAAVAQLKALVVQEQRKGDVTASRATAIEDAADVLLQDAQPTSSPSPSPTSASPTPSPTPTTTSPTPTPSSTPSASPTPSPTSSTPSPILSASVGAQSQAPEHRPAPSSSPSASSSTSPHG